MRLENDNVYLSDTDSDESVDENRLKDSADDIGGDNSLENVCSDENRSIEEALNKMEL